MVKTQTNGMVPINCRISSSIGFPWDDPIGHGFRNGLPQRSSWTASRFHPWYPRRSWRCPWYTGFSMAIFWRPAMAWWTVGWFFLGYRTIYKWIKKLYKWINIVWINIVFVFFKSKPTNIPEYSSFAPFFGTRWGPVPQSMLRRLRWRERHMLCPILLTGPKSWMLLQVASRGSRETCVNGVTPVVVKPPYVFFVGKRMMILIWYWAVNLGFIFFWEKPSSQILMTLWHHFARVPDVFW